jgi:hypothetical protein
MNKFNLSLKYFVYDVPNFKEHKENILSLIKDIPRVPFFDKSCEISHTDWNLPKHFERKYLDYFYKNIIDDYRSWFIKKYNLTDYIIHNCWFQQYNKNNFHNYHTHGNCNFTNVFYLELSDKKMTTEVLNLDNQKIDLECKEGQILSFPGFLLHRSKIIETDLRKTIISFNSSFHLD